MLRSYLILCLSLFTLILASPRLEKITNTLQRTNGAIPDYKTQIDSKPTGTVKDSSFLPLDLRSINDCSLTELLLISDIDGNLHGVERNTGALLWTLPIDEPLVRISTNISDPESNILWIVEPYQDGSLFYFTPKFGMNRLPTSIKDLVLESPFSLSGDDKIYTGTRKTSLYTVNIHTGEIKSSFGNDEKCPVPNTHYKLQPDMADDTIMIGKTTYELSIYSKINTNVVWNVTYSQWGPNNIDNDLIVQNQQSADKLYFTPFHDKSLLAINKDLGTPVWISKLPSLAVNVFDVFHNRKNSEYVLLPHPLKVLNDLQLKIDEETYTANNDLVFVNKTSNGNEWFAMSFHNYPTLIKSAPISQYQLNLYKLQNNVPVDIEYLKNFKISPDRQTSVEALVSGIHKTFQLTADTMYQPVSKFDSPMTNLIGDGSENDENSSKEPTSSLPIDPWKKLMNGIKFPEKLPNVGSDLMVVDNNKALDQSYQYNTIESDEDYEESSSIFQQALGYFTKNVVKRIVEDVLILLLILAILFRVDQNFEISYKKGKFSFHKKIDNGILDYFDNTLKSEKDQNPSDVSSNESPRVSPNGSTLNTSKELPKLPSDKPVKKVTILTPNENLEKDQEKDEKGHSDSDEKLELIEVIDNKKPIQTETSIGQTDTSEDNDDGTKKKRKRGSRGGKRGGRRVNKNKQDTASQEDEDHEDSVGEEAISTRSLIKTTTISARVPPLKKLQIENNLVITDKILGYGSHGTVVYEGTFENRPVAVKRMLLDFYHIASHEVRLLQESDDHPNVIRYFCSQSSESEKFLYIALELCLCSLEDIVEKPKKALRLNGNDMNQVLFQLVSGLHYLHSLKIVHRDLKPQNILVATAKNSKASLVKLADENKDGNNNIRLLISDFGLCKKLESDQSSFRATTQNAASGTSGWRAPELLLNHDLLEISPDTISSIGSNSRHSNTDSHTVVSSGPGKRLTKAIDIFSLGCVFFYILTGGSHPFGDRYLREGNIIKGDYDLTPLFKSCPNDKYEATNLIASMIHANHNMRPSTNKILGHPLFWSTKKRLEFLLKVSDRFEIERREPPSELLLKLETHATAVHQGDWHIKFDQEFLDNLGKYRKYHTEKLMDLLRVIRNKYHHYNDLPPHLQDQMKPLPDGFYKFFNDKFPNLLMEVYFLVKDELEHEHVFKDFF